MARRRERSGPWPGPTPSTSSTRRRCRTLSRPAAEHLDDVAQAIRSMQVRGAPLIGVSAAYGVALALSRAGRRRNAAGRLVRRWPRRGRPRSTCTGRWRACRPACCRCHLRRVPMRRGSRQAGLPTRTSTSVAGSAFTACSLLACRRAEPSARDHDPLQRRLAGHRRPRHCAGAGLCRFRRGNRQCMSGFPKPARATRAC
jgi:hypothetical protein